MNSGFRFTYYGGVHKVRFNTVICFFPFRPQVLSLVKKHHLHHQEVFGPHLNARHCALNLGRRDVQTQANTMS